MIVGFTGKAGCGKDTAGRILGDYGFTRMAFADPLKETAAAIFRVPLPTFHDTRLKERVDPIWGLSPRQMMQGLDAPLKQAFGADLWVRRWSTACPKKQDIVVTDVRFDLEAEAIIKRGGRVFLIVRDKAGLAGEEGGHPSERGISPHLVHGVIENNSSLVSFEARVIDCVFAKEQTNAMG